MQKYDFEKQFYDIQKRTKILTHNIVINYRTNRFESNQIKIEL